MNSQSYPFSRSPRGGNLESAPRGLPSSKGLRDGFFSALTAWAASASQSIDPTLEIRFMAPSGVSANFISHREVGALRFIPHPKDIGLKEFIERLNEDFKDRSYLLTFQDIQCYDRLYFQTLVDYLGQLYTRFSLPVGRVGVRVRISHGSVPQSMDYVEQESVLSLTLWGCRQLVVGKKKFTAKEGEWLYSPPGKARGFTSTTGHAALELRFDSESLASDLKYMAMNSVLEHVCDLEVPNFYSKESGSQPPKEMKLLYNEVRRAAKGLDLERMACRLWLERLTSKGLTKIPPIIPSAIVLGDVLMSVPNRSILWSEVKKGTQLVLSVAGHSVVIYREEAVIQAIKQLNQGKAVSISELAQTLSSQTMAKVAGALGALRSMGAFQTNDRYVRDFERSVSFESYLKGDFSARVDE